MLSRLSALKRGQLWREAGALMEAECQRLMGASVAAVTQMIQTELLARLVQGEPTPVVREKALMVTTLLKEAGDVATAQGRADEARACHLKGLQLLLEILARGEPFEYPGFLPRLEIFVAALQDGPLPPETHAGLMRHYEQSGEFAKAEDCLFALLEADPANAGILEFGVAFYERLRRQTDANLAAGNLPRPELEAGLAELRGRQGARPAG